jgi:NADP-dependent 3-hydroxy acid dehydrogenase YdfG
MSLAGNVAIVTGASSGIGNAIAMALAAAGAHVALGARRVDRLEALATRITDACSDSETLVCACDVTKRAEVEALVSAAKEKWGRVDILVNNAGVMYYTMMKNVDMEQWERQVDVNCKGVMYGVGAVLPIMLEAGQGHIVNITSDAGRKVFPGLSVYSGTKFFVEAMSEGLREETAGTGLKVTCVEPGNVKTELLGHSSDPEAMAKYGEPSGAKVLDPEDIARAVVFAVTQPAHVAVNQLLVEPRDEPI